MDKLHSDLERIETVSQPEINLATAQDAEVVFAFIKKLAKNVALDRVWHVRGILRK